jgi:hypothetical protein
MCDTLVLSINWFRTLLNTFKKSTLPEYEMYKLVLRMNELVNVEDIFYSQCQRYPEYAKQHQKRNQLGSYNPATGQ